MLRSAALSGSDSPLDVRELPAGLYLVEVPSPTATTRLRFVKE